MCVGLSVTDLALDAAAPYHHGSGSGTGRVYGHVDGKGEGGDEEEEEERKKKSQSLAPVNSSVPPVSGLRLFLSPSNRCADPKSHAVREEGGEGVAPPLPAHGSIPSMPTTP